MDSSHRGEMLPAPFDLSRVCVFFVKVFVLTDESKVLLPPNAETPKGTSIDLARELLVDSSPRAGVGC